MTTVKVIYFDSPARGEAIRLLLAYGGVEFEDYRVTMANWTEIKAASPFGQLPLYEEDGKVINQSVAIMRYLGKKHKLNGANSWEDLEIDAMADTLTDFIMKIGSYHYEQSASAKAAKREVLYKETIPFYLERFDKIAKTNNGHLAVKKLTWVDFYFSSIIKYMSLMIKIDILESNLNLKDVYDNVMRLPGVTKWYEKHPIALDGTMAWLEATGKPTKE